MLHWSLEGNTDVSIQLQPEQCILAADASKHPSTGLTSAGLVD